MSDTSGEPVPSTNELALERTRMAGVRTDFALMRTGFTIASFGAGVAEVLGRDNWPDWATEGLAMAFIAVGMVIVQSGLLRSRTSMKELGMGIHASPFSRFAMVFVPWGLQLVLFSLLLLILLH